jgi:hypothetical protein
MFLSYSKQNNGFLDLSIDYVSSLNNQPGDSNLDQDINVLDIVLVIDFIFLELTMNQAQYENSDINLDDTLNIYDIVLLIDLILG